MIMTFKARAAHTSGLQVEASARDFKFIMDEPEEYGGENTGMNPVEAVLCAFGACQTIVAVSLAKAKRFAYEAIWVEAEGDIDSGGQAGRKGTRPGFTEVRYTVHIKTDEPQEKVDDFVRFMAEHCPVEDIIGNSTPIVLKGAVRE